MNMLETKVIDGIQVNPELPEMFDNTPNEERSPEEVDQWWDVPYILMDEFYVPDANYADFVARMSGFGQPVDESETEYNSRIEEQRCWWNEKYPTGYRFTVRCLDGGAWDRSTNYGCFGALDDAIRCAKSLLVTA